MPRVNPYPGPQPKEHQQAHHWGILEAL